MLLSCGYGYYEIDFVSLDEVNGVLEELLVPCYDDCGCLVVVECGEVDEAGGGFGGWSSGGSVAGGGSGSWPRGCSVYSCNGGAEMV